MQKRLRFLCLILAVLAVTGCKKKNDSKIIDISDASQSIGANKPFKWYVFTDSNYTPVSYPANAPSVIKKPWTEAVRISAASSASAEDGQTQNAYLVVNRLGIISANENNMVLSKDTSLFSERTAGNLAFVNGTPIYSLYKSTFFNNNLKDNQHPFLVQFDPVSKISYPLINCDNLTQMPACEVTDYVWDGRTWFCCIKSEENYKTNFSYIKWTANIPLLNLSPAIVNDSINIEESTAEAFRKAREPLPFSNAPERMKKLLTGMASTVPFDLTLYTAGGTSPRHYSNVAKENEEALRAYGIVSQTWSGILFQDGTIYLEGALDNRRILRKGKAVAIRLPKLPYGYNYTSFVISGSCLYAAWEESDFYLSGKSGFLTVDLDATLYSQITS